MGVPQKWPIAFQIFIRKHSLQQLTFLKTNFLMFFPILLVRLPHQTLVSQSNYYPYKKTEENQSHITMSAKNSDIMKKPAYSRSKTVEVLSRT